MEGQFVLTDGAQVVTGAFADDISADEHRRKLLALPNCPYGSLEVRPLCSDCGEHVEELGGVCTDVLRRMLAGLKRL